MQTRLKKESWKTKLGWLNDAQAGLKITGIKGRTRKVQDQSEQMHIIKQA